MAVIAEKPAALFADPGLSPDSGWRGGSTLPAWPGLLIVISLLAPPAAAQTGAPTPLRLETEALERDLEAAQAASGGLPEGRAAAVLQNRITAIEEELRRLTGRVEEAEFREQQTRARIDQLVADLDRRLAALEQRQPAGFDNPTTDDAERPSEAPAASLAPGNEAAPAESEVPRRGAIPRDALLGIPAPSPEGPAGTAPAAALEGGPAERFSAALELLQAGDYAAAEAAFSRWVEAFPDDPQAPVAAYWLGEAQLAQDAHANAAATFAANYRTFGAEAPRAADNLLKLGAALAAMGDATRACQTFAEMARRYPDMAAGLRQALERERLVAGCG